MLTQALDGTRPGTYLGSVKNLEQYGWHKQQQALIAQFAVNPQVIIVMGVSGCGKTTVGAALAEKLSAVFLDADDFHPEANKEKMRLGLPLDDDDRAPWLHILNEKLREENAAGTTTVLACSALKQRYRAALSEQLQRVTFVHLVGTYDALSVRLAGRNHEYMPPTLLKSQLETLEPPADALQIPIAWPLEKQVAFAANSILSHNTNLGV